MTTLSKTEYAKLRGWGKSYIAKLGKQGRLVLTDDGKVDVEATDARIEATADPSKQGVADRWAAKRGEPQEPSTGDDAGTDLGGYDYQAARAKHETHKARIAGLEEAQLTGRLLDAERVIQALTDNAAAMRAVLERLPDRIAPVLAAESDPRRVHQLLDDEVGRVLDELSRIAEQLPSTINQTSQ